MRKLLPIALLLCATPTLAESWVATVSVSGTSANAALTAGTQYTLQCTVTVRFRTDNGSSTTVSTTPGSTYGILYDVTFRDLFDFSTRGNDTYVAIVADPSASGTCYVFKRDR